jgi:hypothetical protein
MNIAVSRRCVNGGQDRNSEFGIRNSEFGSRNVPPDLPPTIKPRVLMAGGAAHGGGGTSTLLDTRTSRSAERCGQTMSRAAPLGREVRNVSARRRGSVGFAPTGRSDQVPQVKPLEQVGADGQSAPDFDDPLAKLESRRSTFVVSHLGQWTVVVSAPTGCSSENRSPHRVHRYS